MNHQQHVLIHICLLTHPITPNPLQTLNHNLHWTTISQPTNYFPFAIFFKHNHSTSTFLTMHHSTSLSNRFSPQFYFWSSWCYTSWHIHWIQWNILTPMPSHYPPSVVMSNLLCLQLPSSFSWKCSLMCCFRKVCHLTVTKTLRVITCERAASQGLS